jgi:hypothetical protein
MTAEPPATLVWIAPDPPDAAQARALASWAQAHGRVLAAPAGERPAVIAIQLGAAEDVEELLDRARDAITARDGDGADRALASAEALLRAHPELPQAGLLMAELERARSTRWRKVAPLDAEAAERSWQRADAVDVARVAGLGEIASPGLVPPTLSPPTVPTPALPPAATIALALPGDDRAWLDGLPVSAVVVTRAGPHALVVTAAGAPVWAGWIDAQGGHATLAIDSPATAPCSTDDAAHASVSDGVVRAERVQCAQWVAATTGAQPGTIRAAWCEVSHCGPLLDWRSPPAWAKSPPAGAASETASSRDRGSRWPVWATWALAGAGVAIVTGVGIVASGALEGAPTETRFVNGGLKTP